MRFLSYTNLEHYVSFNINYESHPLSIYSKLGACFSTKCNFVNAFLLTTLGHAHSDTLSNQYSLSTT